MSKEKIEPEIVSDPAAMCSRIWDFLTGKKPCVGLSSQ